MSEASVDYRGKIGKGEKGEVVEKGKEEEIKMEMKRKEVRRGLRTGKDKEQK